MHKHDLHIGIMFPVKRVNLAYNGQEMNQSTTQSAQTPQPRLGRKQVGDGAESQRELAANRTLVKNLEGFVGRLSDVVVDAETNEITHLIVQQGRHFPEYLEIPIAFAETISNNSIFLSLNSEELDVFLVPANFIYQ